MKTKKIEKYSAEYWRELDKDAALATGANAGSIKECCQGRTKHAGGYRWKYK